MCDRIGIIVSGKLVALGSSQVLKQTYGKHYRLVLQVDEEMRQAISSGSESALLNERVHHFVTTLIEPSALLESKTGGGSILHTYVYQVPMQESTIQMGQIFKTLEENRHRLNIVDYSLSQPTLEQVFLSLSKIYK